MESNPTDSGNERLDQLRNQVRGLKKEIIESNSNIKNLKKEVKSLKIDLTVLAPPGKEDDLPVIKEMLPENKAMEPPVLPHTRSEVMFQVLVVMRKP